MTHITARQFLERIVTIDKKNLSLETHVGPDQDGMIAIGNKFWENSFKFMLLFIQMIPFTSCSCSSWVVVVDIDLSIVKLE